MRSDKNSDTNILVLGASGMLGAALYSTLPQVNSTYRVFGTHRTGSAVPVKGDRMHEVVLDDIFNARAVRNIFKENKIHVVINAIGLIKQIGHDLTQSDFVRLNTWLPHFISGICDEFGARFIEISTDCVFTGENGNYSEEDTPNATDLYGRSKLLGEVTDKTNAITIRTSIIGHESGRSASLIDWFLSTSGDVNGYERAIFSGFPTVVLASIIGNFIIPRTDLHGLYHVSAKPIDKLSLLKLVSKVYDHKVKIIPKSNPVIDRSLNSLKFRDATGFAPMDWLEMVEKMKIQRPVWSENE